MIIAVYHAVPSTEGLELVAFFADSEPPPTYMDDGGIYFELVESRQPTFDGDEPELEEPVLGRAYTRLVGAES